VASGGLGSLVAESEDSGPQKVQAMTSARHALISARPPSDGHALGFQRHEPSRHQNGISWMEIVKEPGQPCRRCLGFRVKVRCAGTLNSLL